MSGTKADFWVDDEWLGSVAQNGYPEEGSDIEDLINLASDEADFRTRVTGILGRRDNSTVPPAGWPHPWETGAGTTWGYVWDTVSGSVLAYDNGARWFRTVRVWPTMTSPVTDIAQTIDDPTTKVTNNPGGPV